MPRAEKQTFRRCKYCQTDRHTKLFKKHYEACKRTAKQAAARRRSPEYNDYIEIVSHPHSAVPPNIIPLDTSAPVRDPVNQTSLEELNRPWAPFRTRADFEYTATAVTGALSADIVNQQLQGITGSWSVAGSMLTIRNSTEMAQSLAAARQYVVQVWHVNAEFEGESYTFEFQYRDPWKWMLDLVTDPSLASYFKWYPVQKFLHEDGRITQIYDESNTGRRWWRVQDSLPQISGLPHCFLPMTIWLDKGIITKTVQKDPIIGCLASLPSEIRNGSGNGGGVLLGYMIIVKDRSDPTARDAAARLAWARFKREVYHKICGVIFKSLVRPSRDVLFPGIPYHKLDGEEACPMCACRAALADFPCLRCLVPKVELHSLLKKFTPRTTASMKHVYEDAVLAHNKTDREHILQAYGLHFTENFFWSLSNSDPYESYTYDVLHSDDLGKWGKHLWPILMRALEERGFKGRLTMNMAAMPRWPGLKHFPNVTTIDITNAEVWYDILKCILPCIVQLLPKNSTLVHYIRAYMKYCLRIGIHCTTEERITRLNGYIKNYEKLCSKVTQEYGKNFDWPKQHFTGHIVDDLREKGTTNHHTTRLGEGFHQEVKQVYAQTNGKNEDAQAQEKANEDSSEGIEDKDDMPADRDDTPEDSTDHWSCGSLMKWITSKALEDEMSGDRVFAKFDRKLRRFLADELPGHQFGDTIMIRQHRCLYLNYQSLENWTEACDILRCNPKFHGNQRHDFVLSLDGEKHDVALVSMLKHSSWRPNTFWDGCRIYEEPQDTHFIFMKYFIRGAYMAPVFNSNKPNLSYLMDTVDYDMYLHAGN
ncbi:hypothetical protein C8R43DRAFT_1092786 [Mycena crocata]|nr:hypothetical protein C8R43DRAFT_1092786 [Mycena crocata]